jgi:platelet-activating factor acetylhydrolase
LLYINSEAFMYWTSNFDAVITLCQEAKANHALAWLLTVRGTVHLSLSDFSVLYPRLFSLLYKATANPHRSILLHVFATLEFLKLVMQPNISKILPSTNNENLLTIRPLDELPDERKPKNEKWIALPLRIPHEMKLRLKPRIVRRYTYRKKANEVGKVLPTDERGKVVDALQELGRGEEVWMHFSPNDEELARHGMGPRKGRENATR